jgi:hypothetical protein
MRRFRRVKQPDAATAPQASSESAVGSGTAAIPPAWPAGGL